MDRNESGEKQPLELDYYNKKKHLKIPEYGRTVQQMVDYCVTIEDREQRNRAAKAVIAVMGEINPHLRNVPDFQHKLWDQLFIMSDFRIEVDSPFPIPEPRTFTVPPDRMEYPEVLSKYRYYGHNVRRMIQIAVSWPEGDKRDALTVAVAKYMRKSYLAWNKDSVEDEVIWDHLTELSDGKLDVTPRPPLSSFGNPNIQHGTNFNRRQQQNGKHQNGNNKYYNNNQRKKNG